jgi:hypothetical protein
VAILLACPISQLSLGYRTPAEFVASRALARADEDFTKEPESVIAFSSGYYGRWGKATFVHLEYESDYAR